MCLDKEFGKDSCMWDMSMGNCMRDESICRDRNWESFPYLLVVLDSHNQCNFLKYCQIVPSLLVLNLFVFP